MKWFLSFITLAALQVISVNASAVHGHLNTVTDLRTPQATPPLVKRAAPGDIATVGYGKPAPLFILYAVD
jgi:hypothetical protein